MTFHYTVAFATRKRTLPLSWAVRARRDLKWVILARKGSFARAKRLGRSVSRQYGAQGDPPRSQTCACRAVGHWQQPQGLHAVATRTPWRESSVPHRPGLAGGAAPRCSACLVQVAAIIAVWCAARARSSSTATVAAIRAAAAAIRAICHPGMPPTTTVWTTWCTCVGGRGGCLSQPGGRGLPGRKGWPSGGAGLANAVGAATANDNRPPASPARAAAKRRNRRIGFMTVSLG